MFWNQGKYIEIQEEKIKFHHNAHDRIHKNVLHPAPKALQGLMWFLNIPVF